MLPDESTAWFAFKSAKKAKECVEGAEKQPESEALEYADLACRTIEGAPWSGERRATPEATTAKCSP
jgi:hypothetical protein